MYNIDKDKQMEVLRWLMYAWDGQWLGRTTAVYGAVEASKLNSRVRTAFAKVEMKGLLALLGKKQAENLGDAAEMLQTYFQVVFGERGFQGKFAPVAAAPDGGARLQIQVSKMTALESLKKVALAANESPALLCELLWTSWLEGLLPDSQLQVSSRNQNGLEIYQIDSLSETFSASTADLFDVPMPEGLAARPATTPENLRQTQPWAGSPTVFGETATAAETPRTNHHWTGGENKNEPAAIPAPESSSPIADVLLIPLEQIKPSIAANPYGGGPISFAPPPAPQLPQPPFGAAQTAATSSSALPQPPFGAAAGSPPLPQPPFGALATPNPNAAPGWPGIPNSAGLIGGTEIGANKNRASSLTDPALQPPPLYPNLGQIPGPVANLGLSLDNTGRPLFSSNTEEEARLKAFKSKSKNLSGISRMFMSKQAKDTFSKSADEPVVQLTSVAMNVDVVLQSNLQQARASNPGMFLENIRVVGGPEGELNIVVGQQIYKSVDDIPNGPIQDILRRAVAEWSESNL